MTKKCKYTLRLDAETEKKISEAAKFEGRSKSNFILIAIKKALVKINEKDSEPQPA